LQADYLSTEKLEAMAAALEASGHYRVLRKLQPRTRFFEPDGSRAARSVTTMSVRLSAFTCLAGCLACDDALRPSEADFVIARRYS
jgi:hypothetical protein